MNELYCVSCFKGVKLKSIPKICPLCNQSFSKNLSSIISDNKQDDYELDERPSVRPKSAPISRKGSLAQELENEEAELEVPIISSLSANLVGDDHLISYKAEQIAFTSTAPPRPISRSKSTETFEQMREKQRAKVTSVEIK